MQILSEEQKLSFEDQGYLVLPGFKTAAQLQAAIGRAHTIVEAFDPEAGASRFSTRNRSLVTNAQLIASGSDVRCFFEEEALDADGQLTVPKAQSINKIGHALHDLDPVFVDFSHGPALAGLAQDLGLQQAQVWQSQIIFKQPRIGGEVGWHQDATFFDTDPVSVTTFWFALEDASLHNGCLWVEPGGHRGPLRERFVRSGDTISMQRLDATPWPDAGTARALEVAAGTLVVFHGLLPHYSAPNRSAQSRHAYTLHVTDGRARYSKSNWIQRDNTLPVRGFA